MGGSGEGGSAAEGGEAASSTGMPRRHLRNEPTSTLTHPCARVSKSAEDGAGLGTDKWPGAGPRWGGLGGRRYSPLGASSGLSCRSTAFYRAGAAAGLRVVPKLSNLAFLGACP